MKFQYNLNYIGGIDGYNKRAIYTLKITDDYFYVNGLIKSKKFAYEQVKGIFFGEIDDLKKAFAEVRLLFEQVSLLDYRLNRKLRCLHELTVEVVLVAQHHDRLVVAARHDALLLGEQGAAVDAGHRAG